MSLEPDSANGETHAFPRTPLTMTVAEYSKISGLSEFCVRQELRLKRIPHRRVGRRGLVRILRVPAIAALCGNGAVNDEGANGENV